MSDQRRHRRQQVRVAALCAPDTDMCERVTEIPNFHGPISWRWRTQCRLVFRKFGRSEPHGTHGSLVFAVHWQTNKIGRIVGPGTSTCPIHIRASVIDTSPVAFHWHVGRKWGELYIGDKGSLSCWRRRWFFDGVDRWKRVLSESILLRTTRIVLRTKPQTLIMKWLASEKNGAWK